MPPAPPVIRQRLPLKSPSFDPKLVSSRPDGRRLFSLNCKEYKPDLIYLGR
jgi:hypothetical protein